MRPHWIEGGVLPIPMTVDLMRKKDTQPIGTGRVGCYLRGGNWSNTSVCQEVSRVLDTSSNWMRSRRLLSGAFKNIWFLDCWPPKLGADSVLKFKDTPDTLL